MNKVFKVVWNEVRASYMVCDENSMTRGKPKSVKTAVLAASVAAMMGFGSIAAAADPVIVEGPTYENVSVTESSNHPLKAQVSATADDASSLTVKDSTFRNNSMTLEDTSGGPAAVGVAATGVDVSVSGSTFAMTTELDDAVPISCHKATPNSSAILSSIGMLGMMTPRSILDKDPVSIPSFSATSA